MQISDQDLILLKLLVTNLKAILFVHQTSKFVLIFMDDPIHHILTNYEISKFEVILLDSL